MKRIVIAGLLAIFTILGFSCKSSVSSEGGSKITLKAADIAAVKGQPIKDGKFTVGKDATNIAVTDIRFDNAKLAGHTPAITFLKGKASFELKNGENTVSLSVTADDYFDASTFSITVYKDAALPTPPAPKITLTKADIATVKGHPVTNGKITVGKDVTQISASDIIFHKTAVNSHTPVVTLGKGHLQDAQLTGDETTIQVNIKGDDNFTETSFSFTVVKSSSPTPSAPPAGENVTLKETDIETILEKNAEMDGKTFKIGDKKQITGSDIKFKESALKGKTPTLTLSSLERDNIKRTEASGVLHFQSTGKPITLYITVSGDGFSAVTLSVTLIPDNATPPTPPAEKITLTADDIETVRGVSKGADGKYSVEKTVTTLSRDDIKFKESKLNGHKPQITTGSGESLILSDGDNAINVIIMGDAHFTATTFSITVCKKKNDPTPPPAPPAGEDHSITGLTGTYIRGRFGAPDEWYITPTPAANVQYISEVWFNNRKGHKVSSKNAVFPTAQNPSPYFIDTDKIYVYKYTQGVTTIEFKQGSTSLGKFNYNGSTFEKQ